MEGEIVCTQKTQPSKKCWGQRWELNLSSSSGSPTAVSPLLWLPSASTWLFLLSVHSSCLTWKQSRVQVFLFMTRNYCQTPHPGCRRPCFASSCCPRARELARPAPGSLCQQPDGHADRHRGVRGLTSLLSSMRSSTDMFLKTLGLKTTSQGTG